LEHEPTLGSVRVDEFPEQARFADAGLAHDRYNLALCISRLVESLAEMVELSVTSHEARQPSRGRRLQTRARRRWPRQLEDLDRPRQPLDWNRANRDDLHEPLGEPERFSGQSG